VTGNAKATVCNAGYFLTVAGASSTCVLCTTSAAGVTSCSSANAIAGCTANYVKVNNLCHACVSNGATCEAALYTLSSTFTCDTGYYLDS
jgi:hypothetical protein